MDRGPARVVPLHELQWEQQKEKLVQWLGPSSDDDVYSNRQHKLRGELDGLCVGVAKELTQEQLTALMKRLKIEEDLIEKPETLTAPDEVIAIFKCYGEIKDIVQPGTNKMVWLATFLNTPGVISLTVSRPLPINPQKPEDIP